MKKRGSNDFPFNDLAGPSKSPRNEPGEQSDVKYDNKTAPKSAFTNSAESGLPQTGADRLQIPSYQQSAQSYQQGAQSHPQNVQSYQKSAGQQGGQTFRSGANQQNAQPSQSSVYQQSASRPVPYNAYPKESREQSRMNTGTPPIDYERRTPRARTLNRQIQILTAISAVLLLIVFILGYFTFFPGKKSSAGTTASTTASTAAAAVTTAMAAAGSPADGVSVTPGASDAAVSPAITPVSASPVAAVDTDPNSLANLPPSKEHPVIALTFDDGPSNTLTPKLLAVLEEKGVHVTFFMLGQMVIDADPAILTRMLADGDELGNHSYDHSIYTDLTEDQVRSELTKTNDAIFAATGVYPTVMRPPTGGSNATVLALSKEMNMPVANWSYESCPEDWLKEHQTPEFISQYVIDKAANGHIVLLHDIHSATVESIAAMIDGLKAKGFRFATVSELLAAQPGGKQTGVLYCYGTFT